MILMITSDPRAGMKEEFTPSGEPILFGLTNLTFTTQMQTFDRWRIDLEYAEGSAELISNRFNLIRGRVHHQRKFLLLGYACHQNDAQGVMRQGITIKGEVEERMGWGLLSADEPTPGPRSEPSPLESWPEEGLDGSPQIVAPWDLELGRLPYYCGVASLAARFGW
jgi:hypothetical protein